MSAEEIRLTAPDVTRGLRLRTINAADIEALRKWKNSQRQFFFDTKTIEPEQQREWFNGFLSRPEDYMFIIQVHGDDIGCMGIRHLDAGWDVYNVILGVSAFGGKGFMGDALNLMLGFAYDRLPDPVRLKVLKKNPASSWYQKNGFETIAEGDDYYLMQHDRSLALQHR